MFSFSPSAESEKIVSKQAEEKCIFHIFSWFDQNKEKLKQNTFTVHSQQQLQLHMQFGVPSVLFSSSFSQ